MKTIKHFEKGLTYIARGAFNAVKSIQAESIIHSKVVG